MNTLYGRVITGLITDENDKYYFVQKSGLTFAMDKSEDESLSIGEAVNGFVYESSDKKKRLTTNLPKSQVGKYGFGTVTQVRKDLGVFVDIGLADKEIVVSLDDLPQLSNLWPKKGDVLMLALKVDKKDRIWGLLADETVMKSLSRLGKENMKNRNITGVAYRLKIVGTYILTDDYYIGFIHPSERLEEPRLGERVSGRVIGVRPDGVLNISLRQRAHEAISDDAGMILALLQQESDGFLPFNDKSSPDAIKAYFGISKGQFKRALGALLKAKKVVQTEEGIQLLEGSDA